MKSTPQLGDFCLVRTPDLGGRLIRIGTDSYVNHAAVYVGDGRVIEARPSGAGYANVTQYENPKYYLAWTTGLFNLTDQQRSKIVSWSIAQIGIKYSWLDIVALGFRCFNLGFPNLVEARIARSDKEICSQLVDEAYAFAGVHLFNDGRQPHDVTPGDLWELYLQLNSLRKP